MDDTLSFERQAASDGYIAVAGLDEAGRGALCGPVVAAAVIPDLNTIIPGIDDSKRLNAKRRDTFARTILSSAVSVGIGLARADEIDEINILQATRRAMMRAIERLKIPPDFLLIDAVELKEIPLPYLALIKGDQRSYTIACASIIAKTTRDRIMTAWDRHYPDYGFGKHKGYGTALHIDALKRLGPSPIHRKTFKKVYNCRTLFDI